MTEEGRISRIWARAILAVATLLARAETLVASNRRGVRFRVAFLESLVERLRAENDLLRARIQKIEPRQRPRYSPWERIRILWHRARYGLSIRAAAKVFVLEASTMKRWLDAIETGRRVIAQSLQPRRGLLDLAAHVARLLRYEQPRWGTRRLAHVLAQLGLLVSRSSVQRYVRREPPRPAKRAAASRRAGLRAREPHDVWLVDFTTVKALFGFVEIRIGAVIDVFSRAVVAFGVTRTEPSAAWTCRLFERGIRSVGRRPRRVITDQGVQFTSKRFKRRLRKQRIGHRFGAVGSPRSIELIERFWRTLKSEWTLAPLLAMVAPRAVERRLALWVEWYHRHRPHQGLEGRSPHQVLGRGPRRHRQIIDAHGHWLLERRLVAGERSLPIYNLRRAA